jgi:hypothetical protein
MFPAKQPIDASLPRRTTTKRSQRIERQLFIQKADGRLGNAAVLLYCVTAVLPNLVIARACVGTLARNYIRPNSSAAKK